MGGVCECGKGVWESLLGSNLGSIFFVGEKREVDEDIIGCTVVLAPVENFGSMGDLGQRKDCDLNVEEFLVAGCSVCVKDGGNIVEKPGVDKL